LTQLTKQILMQIKAVYQMVFSHVILSLNRFSLYMTTYL